MIPSLNFKSVFDNLNKLQENFGSKKEVKGSDQEQQLSQPALILLFIISIIILIIVVVFYYWAITLLVNFTLPPPILLLCIVFLIMGNPLYSIIFSYLFNGKTNIM